MYFSIHLKQIDTKTGKETKKKRKKKHSNTEISGEIFFSIGNKRQKRACKMRNANDFVPLLRAASMFWLGVCC